MQPHQPVLVEPIMSHMAPRPGERYIDATAGFGGHANTIIEAIGESGHATLLDKDPEAIAYLHNKFAGLNNVTIIQTGFADYQWRENKTDLILFDLGVSSVQLDKADRGFSFNAEAPLDMRMNPTQGISAYDIVNEYSEQDLANIIFQFGEETRSRAIARAIVERRASQPIATTTELADIIRHVVRGKSKVDPATKAFQAIRIAVNNELTELQEALPKAARALTVHGRMGVISFHSLEDRIVKQCFKSLTTPEIDPVTGAVAKPAQFKAVTKKPIVGTIESDNNPRARSAKLRIVEKTN